MCNAFQFCDFLLFILALMGEPEAKGKKAQTDTLKAKEYWAKIAGKHGLLYYWENTMFLELKQQL